MRRCTIKMVLDLVQAIESRMCIEGKALATSIDEPDCGHLSPKRLVLLQYTIGLSAIERQLDSRILHRSRIGICCSRAGAGFSSRLLFAPSLTGEKRIG